MNKTIKTLILVAAVLAISILFWWQTSLILNQQITGLLGRLLVFVILFIVFLAVQGFTMVVASDRRLVYSGFLLSALAIFLFFSFSFVYLGGIAIFFICLVCAYELINLERKKYIKVFFNRIMKRGMLFTILGLAVMIGLISYFNNPLLNLKQNDKINLPDNIINIIPKPLVNGIFGMIFPYYQPGMTVDRFISASLTKGVDLNGGKVETNQFFETNQSPDSIVLREQRKILSEEFGFEVNGQDKIEGVMSKFIAAKLNNFLAGLIGARPKEISIGLAAVFFLMIIIIFKQISFLSIWLAKILFSFLRLIGFVKIEKVQKEVEELEI